MAMVSASSAADSPLTLTASAATDTIASRRPIASASSGGTTPLGMGRIAVRAILASMSASHHMLSAPQAPAPAAMADIALTNFSQSNGAGASAKPTAPVNTTSDITRGFKSTRWSTTPPHQRGRGAVRSPPLRAIAVDRTVTLLHLIERRGLDASGASHGG